MRAGEITFAQLERMGAFLDLERKGVAQGTYSPTLYAQRRREARQLGLAKSDLDDEPVEVDLDRLLAPAWEVWKLDPPNGRETGRVETVVAASGRADDNVIDHSAEQSVLPGEIE